MTTSARTSPPMLLSARRNAGAVHPLRFACALASPTGASVRRSDVFIAHSYPEPETEKERSPIDIPQEWITPEPSRRHVFAPPTAVLTERPV
jgi:hypothetical protein